MACLSCLCLLSSASAVPAFSAQPAEALAAYLRQKDDSFQWSARRSGPVGLGRYTELRMVSQTWRGIPWKHQLFVIRPASMGEDTGHALLLVAGGRWSEKLDDAENDEPLPSDAALYGLIAERLRTPIAVLMQVPHQPIFDDLYEDAAIAHTFQQYLDSGDPQWPLLLPMVKSAVRGMDAVQQFAAKEWDAEIKTFTVSGASKRGWTTWLTGASDDRVSAIAPMVIDMLNMEPQIRHQQAAWGDLSYKINDYTKLDLPSKLPTERGRELQRIVDPFQYREALAKPKLIILGTNDHYWPLDALNLYWDQLIGPKYVLYVPNNRHGLKDHARVITSIYALHQHAARGIPLPRIDWRFTEDRGAATLAVTSDVKPRQVRIWLADSPTRDFRQAKWDSKGATSADEGHRYRLEIPTSGFVAMFGEAEYVMDDVNYQLSTNVRIFGQGDAAREGTGRDKSED